MKKPELIYIAGPYRAADAWEVAENIHRAERAHIDSWASRYFDIVAKWGLQIVQTLAESRAGVLMRSLVVPERTG